MIFLAGFRSQKTWNRLFASASGRDEPHKNLFRIIQGKL